MDKFIAHILVVDDDDGIRSLVKKYLNGDNSSFEILLLRHKSRIFGFIMSKIKNRDITEETLLNFAQEKKLPVLGICRGMQMMISWAGGTLKPIQGHVGCRHNIRGEINGNVNSFHNYVVSECPSEFATIATSIDGQIEAIKHKILPWEGWMWHPEREMRANELDLRRVQSLFSSKT